MGIVLELDLSDVLGIDFIVPFVSSYSIKYISIDNDHVTKWVEAVALLRNEGKCVTTFFRKNIFFKFKTPRFIISNGGSHFFNCLFKALLKKYRVKLKVEIPYYPQTRRQLECKTLWPLKGLNLEWKDAVKLIIEQFNEMDEFDLHYY